MKTKRFIFSLTLATTMVSVMLVPRVCAEELKDTTQASWTYKVEIGYKALTRGRDDDRVRLQLQLFLKFNGRRLCLRKH